MRKALILAGLAALLTVSVTACGKKDGPSTGAAAQKPAALVLGPTGYGKLQLGSSESQVKALGLTVAEIGPSYFCKKGEALENKGIIAYNSLTMGVAVFHVQNVKLGVQTPEGIKIGATLADVRKVYPNLKNSNGDPTFETGNNITPVPNNPKGQFLFAFDGGKLTGMDLLLVGQDCV